MSTTTTILTELNNILEMLRTDGIKLDKTETVKAATVLKEDLKDNGLKPTSKFLKTMLNIAKTAAPLVIPIIKALLI